MLLLFALADAVALLSSDRWSPNDFFASRFRPFRSDEFVKTKDGAWHQRGEVKEPMWREELGKAWQKTDAGLWRDHSPVKMLPRWNEEQNKKGFPKNLRTLRKEAHPKAWLIFAILFGMVVITPIVLIIVTTIEGSDQGIVISATIVMGIFLVFVLLSYKLRLYDAIWGLHVGLWGSMWLLGLAFLPGTLLLMAMVVDYAVFEGYHFASHVKKLKALWPTPPKPKGKSPERPKPKGRAEPPLTA